MSTKIYNGYKLKKLTLDELHIFCKKIQGKLTQERQELITNLYGENYRNLYLKLFERVHTVEKTNVRDPTVDFSANAIFFPCDDCVMAITYWEHKSYTKIWEDQPEVTYYGYWNNTDQPEEITDEQ